jgi:hypothetical protein
MAMYWSFLLANWLWIWQRCGSDSIGIRIKELSATRIRIRTQIRFWTRIRIRFWTRSGSGSVPESGSRDWMTKNCKNLTMGKNHFKSKIKTYIYPYRPPWRKSKLHEKPLILQREHPALQNITFLHFLSRVNFAHPEPDLVPADQIQCKNMQIRTVFNQCWGSVTFWCGSGPWFRTSDK